MKSHGSEEVYKSAISIRH